MIEPEVYDSNMEQNTGKIVNTEESKNSMMVHNILAHSYLIYFAGLVIGVFLDAVFKWQIVSNTHVLVWAIIFMLLGTFFIIWAQMTSRKTAPNRNDLGTVSHTDFLRGPYCFTRSPTQVGLTLLIAGFGFFINSISVVVLTLIISILNHFTFVAKQEKRLATKYGESYENYKNKVKL